MTAIAKTGGLDATAWQRFLAQYGGVDQPIRQQLMGLQLLTEGALIFDRHDIALDTLASADQRGLIDRVWLDRCPLFQKVHQMPRFIVTRDHVANRAARVLSAFRSTQTG
jgi:hypothetical protein